MIIINHDYKVVILIYIVIITNIMKLIILRLNTAIKSSPIFEGVTEIIINSQACKGKNLVTRHTRAMRAPRVEIVHNAVKESGRVLPHPSAVFHAYASVDTPWVAQYYPV
jgi:hypothetical protein